MKNTITALVLLVSTFISAQGKFEEGMGKAFQLWKEGKNAEASAMFERIASAEKGSWLPNYYVALVNTTTAFRTQDKATINALLTKAQDALDVELVKDQANAELLVMQARPAAHGDDSSHAATRSLSFSCAQTVPPPSRA